MKKIKLAMVLALAPMAGILIGSPLAQACWVCDGGPGGHCLDASGSNGGTGCHIISPPGVCHVDGIGMCIG